MTTTTTHRRHGDRVPADQRLFGVDRRTLLPASIVLAAAAVMHWGVPWADSLVSYEEAVPAGATMTLAPDIQFTPPTGWGISDGVLTDDPLPAGDYPQTARVFEGSTALSFRADTFAGTPTELLEQVRSVATDDRVRTLSTTTTTVTTDSGITGVLSPFTDPRSGGGIAAFTVDGVGIEVVISTPADTPPADADAVDATLRSITVEEVPA